MPSDDGYMEDCTRICDFMKAGLEKNQFHPKEQHNSRGDFIAINFGISQGNEKEEGTRLSEGRHAGLICYMLFQVPFNYELHGFTSTTGMP